jgi:hypothetical protein
MLPLPQIRVPCSDRSWTIWEHNEGRPRLPAETFDLDTSRVALPSFPSDACRCLTIDTLGAG